MPADSGRGHRMTPVAGDGRGRGHEIFVAGAGTRHWYPRAFCPLPSLLLPLLSSVVVEIVRHREGECYVMNGMLEACTLYPYMTARNMHFVYFAVFIVFTYLKFC